LCHALETLILQYFEKDILCNESYKAGIKMKGHYAKFAMIYNLVTVKQDDASLCGKHYGRNQLGEAYTMVL
jgi:hypothetical protein